MQIKKIEELENTKWLSLKSATYINKNGNQSQWEFVSRKGNQQVVTAICRSTKTQKYLLISQFRVPMRKKVIEFPAGLIDEGETVEDAALRELKEETGYEGKVTHTHPFVSKSAGLSNETTAIVEIETDQNRGMTNMEESEKIDSFWLGVDEFFENLSNGKFREYNIDTQVYFHFLGLKNAQNELNQ